MPKRGTKENESKDVMDELKLAGNAYAKDNWSNAAKHYGTAYKLNPDAFTQGQFADYGYVLIQLQRWKRALIPLNRAIELGPKDSRSYANRALIQLNLFHPELAIADCNQAIQMEPTNIVAFTNRAVALYKLGQHALSAGSATRVVELDHSNSNGHYNLARANEKLGDKASALSSYGRAIQVSICPKKIKLYREHIDRLQAEIKQDDAKVAKQKRRQEVEDTDNARPSKRPKTITDSSNGSRSVAERWSVADVTRWIAMIGPTYEPYSQALAQNAIDGPTLLMMNESLLTELGVQSGLHRTRILSGIVRLREQTSSEAGSELKVDSVDEAALCVVCLSAKKSVLLEPCAHICMCSNCANDIRLNNKCPVCRIIITKRNTVYI